MATLKFKIFLLVLCAIFLSCDNNVTVPSPIEGKWSIINVKGGIAGVDQDYPEEVITWNFHDSDETVTVVNDNTDDTLQDVLPSGTYHYVVIENEQNPEFCGLNIIVDNVNYGCLVLSGNDMIFSQGEADGFTIKFTR